MKQLLLTLLGGLAFVADAGAYNTVTVQDSISTNTHWTNDQQYLLKGYVYVTSGATLTIDSGTIIKGDLSTKGALIIERNAKIYSNGTKKYPVVFTSNQPIGQRYYGDWGGIIICGNAPTNWNTQDQLVEGGPRSKYGGTNPADNSGSISYTRIEFGGIAFSPNNEVNGLTLCGVGNGTNLDHIQVSYSGDDAFEWFGGNVNSKYLVSYRTWDDDFDNDAGYSGKNQFLVSIRDPQIADQSGSKAFESDSYLSGTYSGIPFDANKVNSSVWSNATLVGPLATPTTSNASTNYVAGVQIRRGSGMSLLNSVIIGYPAGLVIDESNPVYGSTSANIANGTLQFRNNVIAGIPTTSTNAPGGAKEIVYVKDGARDRTPTATNADTLTNNPFSPAAGPFAWLYTASYNNRIYANEGIGTRLFSPFNLSNPNLIPTTTSPMIYNTKGNGSATAGSFNTNRPINYDTSNGYANYNVPLAPPDFTNNKASDPFFTPVNYVGAFTNTSNPSDNWMAAWTNFDPVNTDYNKLATAVVNVNTENSLGAHIYPNPARNNATVMISLQQAAQVNIALTDVTGKEVANIYNAKMAAGTQATSIDLSNVNPGIYFISVTSGTTRKTLKLSVIK